MNNPYFSLVRAVWHYGKPWRRAIVAYYLAYVIAQICLSLSPYAFGRTIDVLQSFKPELFGQLLFWLGVGIAVLLLFWVFHGPARVVERNVALKIQQAFRLRFYEQLTHLPLKWHQDHHSGNIVTRINRASVALNRFAGDQFIYIEAFVRFVVSILFLMWISVPVGLLSFVTSLIVIANVFFFDRKLIPLYDAQNEIDNRIGAVFFDYINNMTTILTLRLGQLTHSNIGQRLLAVWPFFRKEAVLNELKWFIMMLLLSVVQALTLIGYILFTLDAKGTIMIGAVVMIFRYQVDLSQVFYELSVHYSELTRMDTDVKGLQPILVDIKKLAHLTPGQVSARQWHKLSIDNLYFKQTNNERIVKIFDGISLNIQRGEKIALIGLSGGGKSTLLNLLSGLYSASSVRLTIDDTAPFDSLEPLQAITTLIPQDPEIFENTVAFNITMDLPTKEEEILHVIQLASFSKILSSLPQGLQTDIREKGLNLSVGQKQRLALARGLFAARFSSLILMDEPTSSVDLPTENEILSNAIDAFPQATLIVSMHRLHLLPKFDRIILLNQGQILADGPAADLLYTEGPVRDLWIKYQQK